MTVAPVTCVSCIPAPANKPLTLNPEPCRQAQQQQPRETLEQHLYAFLTQKYGMRQLIMEWLSAILAAVEHFAPRDADVALFDKVLRQAPASCSCLIGLAPSCAAEEHCARRDADAALFDKGLPAWPV